MNKIIYWYEIIKVNTIEKNTVSVGDVYGSPVWLKKQNLIYSEKEKDFIVDFERRFLFRSGRGEPNEMITQKIKEMTSKTKGECGR